MAVGVYILLLSSANNLFNRSLVYLFCLILFKDGLVHFPDRIHHTFKDLVNKQFLFKCRPEQAWEKKNNNNIKIPSTMISTYCLYVIQLFYHFTYIRHRDVTGFAPHFYMSLNKNGQYSRVLTSFYN